MSVSVWKSSSYILAVSSILSRYLLSVVLLTVGGVHYAFVTQSGLTPWKGGGFGMFSTVDSGATRRLVIMAEAGGVMHRVVIPQRLQRLARATRLFPSNSRVESLAHQIMSECRWAISTGTPMPKPKSFLNKDHPAGVINSREVLIGVSSAPVLVEFHSKAMAPSRERKINCLRVEVYYLQYSIETHMATQESMFTSNWIVNADAAK